MASATCSVGAHIEKHPYEGFYYIDTSYSYSINKKVNPPPYQIKFIVYVDGGYLTEETITSSSDWANYYNGPGIDLSKKPEPGTYTVVMKVYDSQGELVCEASTDAGTISKSFWDDPTVKYSIIVGIFLVIAAIIRASIR